MAIKPKKDTYTVKTSGNKTTKTWEYDDGTSSSVTTTNKNKNLDPKFGRKVPTPVKKTTPKPTPKPKVTSTPKPKVTPTPKFTAPTLAEYKSSAAYRAGNLTYKQYIDMSKSAYDAKYKKR
jgi:hypothetical protein